MAEFQEVMRQWKRMCDTYTTDDAVSCCKGCPMSGRGCGSIYESGNADPDVIERETMSWAAEHPEPVYPTWIEWLKKFGIISFEPDFHSLLSAYPTRTNSVKAYINEEGGKPIPADLAQKLGIEPKEDA